MSTILAKVNLETTDCCVCGIIFAIPDYLLKKRQNDGGNFFCPNGHSLVYKITEVDRLKKQLEWQRSRADNERDQRESAERSLRSTKAAHTRTKNRIKNGVCPHCNRFFKNLHSHMETKHSHIQEVSP